MSDDDATPSWTAAGPTSERWSELAEPDAQPDQAADAATDASDGDAMTAEVPAVSQEQTETQPAPGAVWTGATPWWSAAATPAPEVAPAPAAPARAASKGNTRSVLLSALVGATVASLVTGLLFVAFRDDTKSSTSDTAPAAITGANSRDTVPISPNGTTGMDVHAVVARIQPAVVRIRISTNNGDAAGTGIVIDPNGTIVTNAHVVDGANTIQVQLPNGDLVPATSKGVDPSHDLAVITIKRTNLASAVLGDSDSLSVGDPVVAVGNALNLGISVTSGIISAIDRDVPEPSGSTLLGALQTDAAINPGNSGGPLVNARGEVIGINTAIAPPSDASNVGFAIAISAAKPIIADLAEGRTPHDALLGVASVDITPSLVQQHKLPVTSGVYVEQVDSGTAAAKAGIVKGDVIISLDGRAVTTTEQMRRYIRRNQPGDKLRVVYVTASGQQKTATVTLGASR
jgi:putative serine protease PepD